jgi:hypothetical protein
MVQVGTILRPLKCAAVLSSRALLASPALSQSPQLVCTVVSRACSLGEPAFRASASSGGVWPVTEYRRCVTMAKAVQRLRSNNDTEEPEPGGGSRVQTEKETETRRRRRRVCAARVLCDVLAACTLWRDPDALGSGEAGGLRMVSCGGGGSGLYRLGIYGEWQLWKRTWSVLALRARARNYCDCASEGRRKESDV